MATIAEKAAEAVKVVNTLRDRHWERAHFLSIRAKKCPVHRDRSPMKPDLIDVVAEGIKLTWKNPLGPNEVFIAPWDTLTNDTDYKEN